MLTKIQFEAFGTCCAPKLALPEISTLRIWLLSNLDNLARTIEFAAARDLLPVFEHCLSRYALAPPEARSRGDGDTSLHAYLRLVRQQHLERRAAMRNDLIEVVRALNANGIEPLLLKGCTSLWEERDAWRQMRDLDILVAPNQILTTSRALASLGFRESPEAEGQRFKHHLPPLVREGMPGWLEVHFSASNSKAEKYLPTREIWAASTPSTRDGGHARILPAPHHAMHGLAHNHFGHRSSSFGTLNLKGLQEFAWAVAEMNAADRQSLHAMSFRAARLRGAFELWVSAAASFYRLSLPPDWTVGGEAKVRAEEVLWRSASGAHEPLVTTFVKAATEDLGEPGGDGRAAVSWIGRVLARLKAVRIAGREIIAPWRDRSSLRDKSAGIRR